jgi:hypothetical protein
MLAPNNKQHILSPAKLRKVCYLIAELYVKSVYLNLFGWSGRKIHDILRGAKHIKVLELLSYTKPVL